MKTFFQILDIVASAALFIIGIWLVWHGNQDTLEGRLNYIEGLLFLLFARR